MLDVTWCLIAVNIISDCFVWSFAFTFDDRNYRVKYIRLIAFCNLSAHYHFVYYKVCLFDVEHNVELAHVFEVLIQCFDKVMDEFQETKLVLKEGKMIKLELKVLTTSSSLSTPMIKYSDAYLRYMTLYYLCSRKLH